MRHEAVILINFAGLRFCIDNKPSMTEKVLSKSYCLASLAPLVSNAYNNRLKEYVLVSEP
ncbi:MAG TPA: hypothetical protein DDW54_04095 [Clostridiales bacterium]|nr:hypothetical protein [Clostridiales bacterium]